MIAFKGLPVGAHDAKASASESLDLNGANVSPVM